MMIFWWLLIIALLLTAIRVIMRGRVKQSNNQNGSPLEILKRRYAKGEITKEEFKERKNDLKNS